MVCYWGKKMLPALHRKIVHEKFDLVTHKNLEKKCIKDMPIELDKPGEVTLGLEWVFG